MKISEVIKRLEELKKQYGDIPVEKHGAVGEENYGQEIEKIEFGHNDYDRHPVIVL